MRCGEVGVRKVDEDPLAVARRCDADQRPDGFDVAARLADETADVVVGELHLDGNRPGAALESLDRDFFRLLGQGLRDVFHQGAVIDARPAGHGPVAAKSAAAVEPAATARSATTVES